MRRTLWDCSKTVIAGEVAEWLMAPVLKTGIRETVSGVRIPPSPPDLWFLLFTVRDYQLTTKFRSFASARY